MGGRSGQSVRVSSQTAVSGNSYPDARIAETGTNTTGITTDKLIQMAGVPKDFQGEIQVMHRDNGRTRIEIEHDGLTMWRTIDAKKKTIKNAYFEIKETSKYKGKGYKIFEQQVKALRKQKFTEITTNAAGDVNNTEYNGYYTWARFGYQPIDAARIVESVNRNNGTQFASWYEMMNTATGQKLWKKNGVAFAGVFDLKNGSPSMKTWNNYLKYRRAQSQ